MKASNVSNLLYQQLNFRGERQKVISNNIANINTPNYKTKDLSFNGVLDKTIKNNDLQLMVTHKNHIRPTFTSQNHNVSHYKVYNVQGLEEQNDGNNVNLDKQMSEMSKNSILFDAIKNSVKKDGAWFKEVIAASGKN